MAMFVETLSAGELAELATIQQKAKERHEKARKAARAKGRIDFPLLPFECSWAFETQFRSERFNRR